ncbi:hypothetical protein PstZobell_01592 [Stutzerimonas stutzeri ATCC 14405 = CCUG 16156]|nr:hypothetical protein PstZobell_01592 [Stutzerimonas stutzeri ATCC 14405 = CCUG 16156]
MAAWQPCVFLELYFCRLRERSGRTEEGGCEVVGLLQVRILNGTLPMVLEQVPELSTCLGCVFKMFLQGVVPGKSQALRLTGFITSYPILNERTFYSLSFQRT